MPEQTKASLTASATGVGEHAVPHEQHEPLPITQSATRSSSRTTKSKAPTKKKDAKQRRDRKTVPPPPMFDIDALPASALLTQNETAGVFRKSAQTLRLWRLQKDHPLKCECIDGQWFYRVGEVRAHLARPSLPRNNRGQYRMGRS
jgi:hypothetical protein